MSGEKRNPLCACPADCAMHGKCGECLSYHHGRGEVTHCEYAKEKLTQGIDIFETDRPVNLLHYAPCPG